MEKLTPKEVFTYIRDKKGFLEGEEFICLCIVNAPCNQKLMQKCRRIMIDNKPKNDSFTKFDYWFGGCSWWGVDSAKYDGKKKELYQEKRRFLTHLIDKL